MELGFYYHSTFIIRNNKIYVAGYIGVFIEELSRKTKKLYLFLEEQPNKDSNEEDYPLTAKNIELIPLGLKSSFYKRLLYPNSTLQIFEKHIDKIDLLLLRSPSPLSPKIYNRFHQRIPVYNLLVGNYVNGLKDLQQPFFRKAAIYILTYYYQWLQNKMIKKSKIIVNSEALLIDNKKRAKEITLVKTTTLNENSFYEREDTCQNIPIRILYTGRINFQKGIRELIEAVALLKNKFDIIIDIVGWEDSSKFSYIEALKQLAEKQKIPNKIIFHGRKKIGNELDSYYRNSDIYVIASYHEGFPRTIWEAMANSLPVIATKVGSIPFFLNSSNTSLIESKNTKNLSDAICNIIENKTLRIQHIKEGYALAKECTLNKQTDLLVTTLKKYISNNHE